VLGQSSSIAFDGSGDYISAPATIPLSGDFTIDFWAYFNNNDQFYIVVGQRSSAVVTGRFIFGMRSSGVLYLFLGAGTSLTLNGTTVIPTGVWHHIACTRTSNVFRLYLNGSLEATSGVVSTSIENASLVIGRDIADASRDMDGHISELRITNTAEYTSNFIPPTRPYNAALTTYYDTIVRDRPVNYWRLGEASGDAIDEVGQHDLTWAGTPVYGETGPLVSDSSTAMTLDGATEYASKSVANYRSGDSQGSIEAWVTAANTDSASVLFSSADSASANYYFFVAIHGTGYAYFVQRNSDTEDRIATVETGFNDGSYHHVVITSSGTAWAIYVDGVEKTTTVIGGSNSGDWFSDTTGRDLVTVGALQYHSGVISGPTDGSLAEVAVYNYPLTPEQIKSHYLAGQAQFYAARLTIDDPVNWWRLAEGPQNDPHYANVSLLLPMYGADQGTVFTDESSVPKTITRYGNTKTVTAQSQYYGSSGYFDGSGDYLSANSADFAFGTGDFTMECWVYPINTSNYRTFVSTRDALEGCFLGLNDDVAYPLVANKTVAIATSTIAVAYNAWSHVAVSRSGSTLRLFVNGVVGATATNATNFASSVARIGTTDPNLAYTYQGSIQDLRITKGVARYTENFTPPGLLGKLYAIDQQGEHHLTWYGTPVYGDPGPIAHGDSYAMTLDGSTEYARKAVAGYRSGDSQGSIEFWIYQSIDDSGAVFSAAKSTANFPYLYVTVSVEGAVHIGYANNSGQWGGYTSGDGVLVLNQYNHVVCTGTGTSYKVYVNGSEVALSFGGSTNIQPWFNSVSNSNTISIGNYLLNNANGGFLAATTSDIAVYNYPLTPDEVKAHYEAGLWSAVPPFNIAGVIYDDTGAPCQRIVRVYNRATGALILETTSDPITGVYQVNTTIGEEVQRVVLDDSAGQIYNDIIDRILPGTN
jgi:hypothetical protein